MLVNPADSDKIVRPRLAAPLFSMHTFYQVRLQQQLCRPVLIPLVSFIDSIIKRDQAFALNLASPSAPSLGLAPQPAPRLRLAQRLCSHKLFPTRPVWRLRDSHHILFATLCEAHRGCSRLISLNRLSDTVQSAALLKSGRRRRTRRRASQELNQEAGAYRTAWMVMNF